MLSVYIVQLTDCKKKNDIKGLSSDICNTTLCCVNTESVWNLLSLSILQVWHILKHAQGVSQQFFKNMNPLVLKHSKYVEIKQFSKVPVYIKQTHISTILLLLVYQVSCLSMRSTPFARKLHCLHTCTMFMIHELISEAAF